MVIVGVVDDGNLELIGLAFDRSSPLQVIVLELLLLLRDRYYSYVFILMIAEHPRLPNPFPLSTLLLTILTNGSYHRSTSFYIFSIRYLNKVKLD